MTAPLVDLVPIADVLAQARALEPITDAAHAERVGELLAAALDLRAQVDRTFDEHIARAYDAHRALIAEKRQAQAPAVEAERVLRALLVTWAAIEDERQRRELAAADDAREAIAAQLEMQASAAEATGDYAAAEAARLAIASTAPLAVAPRALPTGVSARETWAAQIDDFGALVRAAAAHAPWLALLLPNQKALDQQARSLRHRLAIPGVTARRTTGIAARRRP